MSSYRDTLRQPGFQPFLWTQFLGAVNDNLFKIVVTMLAVRARRRRRRRPRAVARRRALHPAVPAVLRDTPDSSPTGSSKRTILVVTKFLEVVVMALGMIALAAGYLAAAYRGAVSHGAALDVLQPGEVRNPA